MHTATKLADGSYSYRGYAIERGYSVLGKMSWLVIVESGTLAYDRLTDAKRCIDNKLETW